MTLGLELFGAFIAGVGFTIVLLVTLGPRLVKRQLNKKLAGMMAASSAGPKPGGYLSKLEESVRDQGGL